MSAPQPPLVGIIMGSKSDREVMEKAAASLDLFQIPYEWKIVSAHRTPRRLIKYAKKAEKRGLRIIIAGAGGAAHLPGMTAALTPLPVIGVPISSTCLQGFDALLSICQMPEGTPVATVGIDDAFNAGLLAAQILGVRKKKIRQRVRAYKKSKERKVLADAKEFEKTNKSKRR